MAGTRYDRYIQPEGTYVPSMYAGNPIADRLAQLGAANAPAPQLQDPLNFMGVSYVPPPVAATVITNTPGVTATVITDTPGVTATTAAPVQAAPAAPVQAAPVYVPPQVAQGGVGRVRQATPCELGLGGCENPVNVSSNLAAWELDPNRPLSVLRARGQAKRRADAARDITTAAQAGAAEIYDRALADPAFEATVRANMEQGGMPYNVAVANARNQLTGSSYAQNLLGTPDIIRAVDSVASQNRAAAAVANAPYVYEGYNNSAGYVPSGTTAVDPSTGVATVNGRQYNLGMTGPSASIATWQSIDPGMQGYGTTALGNIAAVGKVQQAQAKSSAEYEQELAKEKRKLEADREQEKLRIAGRKEVAQIRATAKTTPPAAPGVPPATPIVWR